MSQPALSSAVPQANGASTPHELFVLTDEQILEIEPEAQDAPVNGAAQDHSARTNPAVISSEARNLSSSNAAAEVEGSKRDSSSPPAPRDDAVGGGVANYEVEPPRWLADRMADPQTGGEAREFWQGIQQARQEAAAYREVFAKPEDARAAAERARTLEEIDAAFYGGAGQSPEQASAARMQLAQRMLREDPAAFREMVFAGLRALEEARPNVAAPSGATETARETDAGLKLGAARASSPAEAAHHAQLTAYRTFEKSANEELERSVGGAIERALTQALPVAQPLLAVRGRAETQAGAPTLQERLGAAIREDVERALKGDRQLSEQVAQILASRRFDDATRSQVVRLINDRAQQLVPVAAKRVINDWTQATLSAHRTKTQTEASAAERPDLASAQRSATAPRTRASESGTPGRASRSSMRPGRVDYGKLSDEQILDM
jgi:hypothetical protein